MKILLVFNNLTPPEQPGLPRPYEIAAFLRDEGHDVTAIASCRNYLDDSIQSWAPGVNLYQGLKVIGVVTTMGRRKSLLRRLRNYLSFSWKALMTGLRLPDRQNVVVTATPPLVVPLTGLLLGWKHGARTILDIGDLYPETAVALRKVTNPVLIKAWGLFESTLRKRYDHLVACVPHIYDTLLAQGHPAHRVTLVPNGVDLSGNADVSAPPWLLDEFASLQGSFKVIYGGVMGYGVNLKTVLEAAALLRDKDGIVFMFFGNGELRQEYERYVAERHLANCRFYDPQPRDVIKDVFRRAGALIHSYYDDGFFEGALPNKIFDYHGSGRPVIFAGRGSSAELIEHAGSGVVVPPERADKMAEAIEALAGDTELADRMGRQGRQFVTENYARRTLFLRWNHILNRIVEAQVPTTTETEQRAQ